jgi:CRISPR-associated exonuclease Cas4
MFGVEVPQGALFYGQTRRRQPVAFDQELRDLTARVAAETRAMIAEAHTPPPRAIPACDRCSLEARCSPARLEKPPAIRRWLAAQVAG